VTTPAPDDRRTPDGINTRGRGHRLWDLVFTGVRLIARYAKNVYAVFGIFLLSGALVTVASTWAFVKLAGHVRSGATQAFDDAVLRWVAAHQLPILQSAMLEVTALGTGSVVMAIGLIAGMFLWLNHHRHSATLLAVATLGGLVLNSLLKIGFDRPRPQVFEWGTQALSSSFPSGHATSAAIVYVTVAYLAARLQQSHGTRILTMMLAVVIVLLISVSRVYLGVHYPSDVLAGVTFGLAWAAFCMAILESTQLYARRNAPQLLRHEEPAPPIHPRSAKQPAPRNVS
jgi:undecaprenyl-diphosphatase